MNNIIWLSSYPKGGNTWIRYLIANYFFNHERKNNYKIIKKIKGFPNFDILKKISTKKELSKYPYNISKYWIKCQELMKMKNGNVVFLKNHNALVNINNHEFTNENYSLASIYIVRDPRDIVISFAKYQGWSYDQTIKHISSKKLLYVLGSSYNFPSIDIPGSWKFHYISWRDGIPKILIKYEDLIDDCYANFYKIVEFLSKILSFKIKEEQIKFSVESSNFLNLQKYEKKLGFFENEGKSNFFRSGKKGSWKQELSLSQIKIIEKEFKIEMKLLGYI